MSPNRPRPGHDEFVDVDEFVDDLESKEDSSLSEGTEILEGDTDEFDPEYDDGGASSLDDFGVEELNFDDIY